MNLSIIRVKPSLVVCISAVMLAACGDSDLEKRFENKIAQAGETVATEQPTTDVPATDVVISDNGDLATVDGLPFDKILWVKNFFF